MRIVSIKIYELTQALVHEFRTSSHQKSSLTHHLVAVTDELGNTGWGEIASPKDPYYAAETVETCWNISVDYLAPSLLGFETDTVGTMAYSFDKVRGNYFAKAGFDIAMWDLWGKRLGKSTASLLGATRSKVVAGVSLGIEPTLQDLFHQIEKHLASGYQRIKLKIAPDWDVDVVRAVRDNWPNIDLHVDANGVYSSDNKSHMAIMLELDKYNLTMIEQPFHPRDFLGHAELQQKISGSVCLDESVEDLADLKTAISLKSAKILNIKVSRMGGLTNAKRAHDLAFKANWPVWCGGMHEFGIGRAANIAIASLPGFILTSDVSGSDKYYAQDITTEAIIAVNGEVDVLSSPGIAYEPDISRLDRNKSRYKIFEF